MLSRILRMLFSGSSLLLVACQQGGVGAAAPPAPGASSVTISAISPSPQKVLTVGELVKLSVDVTYSLDAESGTVRLVVQSADHATLAYYVEQVTRGSGHLTLKAEFFVPNTKAIEVFTPLGARGQARTSTADIRTFKVGS
jgi:hypothetical protein